MADAWPDTGRLLHPTACVVNERFARSEPRRNESQLQPSSKFKNYVKLYLNLVSAPNSCERPRGQPPLQQTWHSWWWRTQKRRAGIPCWGCLIFQLFGLYQWIHNNVVSLSKTIRWIFKCLWNGTNLELSVPMSFIFLHGMLRRNLNNTSPKSLRSYLTKEKYAYNRMHQVKSSMECVFHLVSEST